MLRDMRCLQHCGGECALKKEVATATNADVVVVVIQFLSPN